MQSDIIPPVDISLIEAELTPERHLRATNRAGNDIYVIDAHSAPHTMREIGRLREISFRAGGGGTGEEEADEVGQDFECDDPPGVADVDAGALGLLGVVEDALGLVLVDFYFHGGWG